MQGKKSYVVAVSGGVDSVVLLDMLMANPPEDTSYIVAHFDHGIRPDSHKDAEFVRELAEKYDCIYEHSQGKLGPSASEATAREARYEFLRKVAKKYKAEKIITAHHQDDVLETIVINLLRQRGVRALRPMHGQPDILRPLLHKTKDDLLEYAKKHSLNWREDSTNQDETYLRNYVRRRIIPRLTTHRDYFLGEARAMDERLFEIESRIRTYLPRRNVLYRPAFVTLPWVVQTELVRQWLEINRIPFDDEKVRRTTIAIKTMKIGKKLPLTTSIWLVSYKKNVLLSRQ